jgi:splicing factor 1
MARDCPVNRDPTAAIQPSDSPISKGGFDSEYANLMAELGEGGKGSGDMGKTPWVGSAGHDITAGGSNIPPWRRPEMWQTNTPNAQPTQPQPYRPPGYDSYGGAAGGGYGTTNSQWGAQGYPGQLQQGQDYGNYAQYYQNQYTQQQTGTPTTAH